MYIYSDLIESLLVGDVKANILRTIVPHGQPGKMVAEEIKTPTYHRLRTSVFSSVEINIRCDTGHLVPFAFGNVGKRLLNTEVDRGMQIAKDVINGQSLKKAAKARAKTVGKQFLTCAFQDLMQQGRGGRLLKRKRNSCQFKTDQETENITFKVQDHFRLKMASAHPLSAPGENSRLQLFQVPVTDVSILKSKWVDDESVQSGTNPIEFVIKPLSDYIDINKTQLRLVVKITKRNGGNTGGAKKYTFINNVLHSLIKQFTIKLNETVVTEQSDTQAYNAYIKTLFNFTEQTKKSYLTKALYYKDTAGHMDVVDNTSDKTGDSRRGVYLPMLVLK